jgi:nicotinate-nucleotide pyrophosphorylase (carboxylating)
LKAAPIDLELLDGLLQVALREDVGTGDITSRATVGEDCRAAARYTPKQSIVVAGLSVVERVLHLVDPRLQYRALVEDGDPVEMGIALADVRGAARSILTAERLTLNLLQRMCGIATLTAQYVERMKGTRARLVDTRKTAPGLRVLDKYAVACGGGLNHRMGLFDAVLIKNNHLAFHISIACAIQEARRQLGHLMKIEVEVPGPDRVAEAIDAGANSILLDNFTPEETRQAVTICAGRVPLESSGGITLENIREYAEAGVDYISVGALTHSVTAADIHLRVMPENGQTT